MACEKEEHLVNKTMNSYHKTLKIWFKINFIFQWDTLIDDSKNDDEFFLLVTNI